MPPHYRAWLALGVLIPLGLGTKAYLGPWSWWVHAYAGALCYEVFWILLLKVLLPRAPVLYLGGSVFGVTSLLEFLQLSHHPWLKWVRSYTLGRILIGDGFDPWDFVYYLLGTALGIVLSRFLIEPDSPSRPSPVASR